MASASADPGNHNPQRRSVRLPSDRSLTFQSFLELVAFPLGWPLGVILGIGWVLVLASSIRLVLTMAVGFLRGRWFVLKGESHATEYVLDDIPLMLLAIDLRHNSDFMQAECRMSR